MSKEYSNAAIALEMARQKFPDDAIFVVTQNPSGAVFISTNIEPQDLRLLILQLAETIDKKAPEELPIPKL